MEKNTGSFVLVICGVLAIYMIGCGSLEKDAAFVRANPPSGSAILPDNTITVTFDNTPLTVDVEIQGHPDTSFFWELDGRKLTVRGNPEFQVGKNYIIIISWATGRKILNYTARPPPEPPKPPPPPEPPPATFVGAVPPSGSEISANASIIVTFDNDPGDVTASAGTVAGSGKVRTISGPFKPGAFSLIITWPNGDSSQTFNYAVIAAD